MTSSASSGSISSSSAAAVSGGSSAIRSAASSGDISSRTSAARSASSVLEDLDLVLLGQLLEHVGEPLVVERGHDARRRRSGGRSWITLAASAGRISLSACEQVGGALGRLLALVSPVDLAPLHDVGLAAAAQRLGRLLDARPG